MQTRITTLKYMSCLLPEQGYLNKSGLWMFKEVNDEKI